MLQCSQAHALNTAKHLNIEYMQTAPSTPPSQCSVNKARQIQTAALLRRQHNSTGTRVLLQRAHGGSTASQAAAKPQTSSTQKPDGLTKVPFQCFTKHLIHALAMQDRPHTAAAAGSEYMRHRKTKDTHCAMYPGNLGSSSPAAPHAPQHFCRICSLLYTSSQRRFPLPPADLTAAHYTAPRAPA